MILSSSTFKSEIETGRKLTIVYPSLVSHSRFPGLGYSRTKCIGVRENAKLACMVVVLLENNSTYPTKERGSEVADVELRLQM